MDASFKEAKHLAQCNGEAVFSGLLTIKNQYNEARSQFRILTDAQDQYLEPIRAMTDTM